MRHIAYKQPFFVLSVKVQASLSNKLLAVAVVNIA